MKLTQKISLPVLFCLMILLNGCGFLQGLGKPSMQEVKSLGKLTVGKLLPSYGDGSPLRRSIGTKPSRGEYLIHLLHPKLPPTCVDYKCGVSLDLGKPQKIQLYGGSDLKLADIGFGIFSASTSEEFSKQSQDYGILVISDQKGKIISIFNHVQLSDVAEVMKRQNL
jgi:hypothetical protein